MRDLGLHRFEQRKTTIQAVLDHLGEATLVDSGRGERDRALRFELHAPGHGLTIDGTFIYAEWYHRVPRGWRLTRYHYDYVDRRLGGRLGYHWHVLAGRLAAYHAHCEQVPGAPAFQHYRAYEVDLLEAHEEFVRRYAEEAPIDCSRFRPFIQ